MLLECVTRAYIALLRTELPCMCACRNADVSNTFKVDLHALHVDEALYEVEKCIKDLSKFKCESRDLCYALFSVCENAFESLSLTAYEAQL